MLFGATDVANRNLEFRVAANDEEYCVECLDKKKKAAESDDAPQG
ncbi:MAG: hypothetical protein AAF514_13550 [Verrucomicrobiota bacterium]